MNFYQEDFNNSKHMHLIISFKTYKAKYDRTSKLKSRVEKMRSKNIACTPGLI